MLVCMGQSTAATNPIVIQSRDIEILRGLFESRVMTASHIAGLFFNGSGEAAKKRLQALKAAGLVTERPRKTFELAVLHLAQAGLNTLAKRGILKDYPPFEKPVLENRGRVSDITLRHELEVMDVKVAFYCKARTSERFSIVEFTTWPRLNEFVCARTSARIKPDGFIRIRENGTGGCTTVHALFLELDRSTETQSVLLHRATCYLDHYRSGGFARRFGAERSQYKNHPFRVLYVLQTEERRNNIAERLLRCHPPLLTQVWLTTSRQITTDPFGAIWIRPVDYQNAIASSPFTKLPIGPGYPRNSDRERFLQLQAKLHPLFPPMQV